MKRLLTIGALVLVVAVAATAQSNQIQNAQMKPQAVTSLSRDVAALIAQATTPRWVAWQVPMIDGERNKCCYYSDDFNNGVKGCRLEPQVTEGPSKPPQIAPPSGPVRLEAGTQVTIFVRLLDKRIERLRALTDDCSVDAGGLDLHWLTGVTGADSVAWLKARALDETMEVDVKSKISNAAVRAIALHRDPSAVATLIEFARAAPQTTTATSLRREAMTGLGQSRDPRALQFLSSIITK